jgi:hypothetical protein
MKIVQKSKEKIESKFSTEEILDLFFETLNFSSSNKE